MVFTSSYVQFHRSFHQIGWHRLNFLLISVPGLCVFLFLHDPHLTSDIQSALCIISFDTLSSYFWELIFFIAATFLFLLPFFQMFLLFSFFRFNRGKLIFCCLLTHTSQYYFSVNITTRWKNGAWVMLIRKDVLTFQLISSLCVTLISKLTHVIVT